MFSRLTNCIDKVIEVIISEQRLWQFSEKHLKSSCDDMYIFPFTVIQV